MSVVNLSGEVSDVAPEESENHIFMHTDDEFNSEYTDSIWAHLLQQEKEKQPIHLQSPQLAYRGALVKQLRDIVKKLGMSIATLHCAVAHLDLFMDAHRLRSDRITHVALACLSLAAKSEEKFNEALTLSVLSSASGVELSGKTFRNLEWMVGQHLRWKLLASTAFTFASILAKYVVQDSDLISHNPVFVKRFKRDGAKLLEAYLDMTLSDVRLKAVESVDVGCACIACVRADLGLCAWPTWLANITTRRHDVVTSIAKLLQKMMLHLKTKKTQVEVEVGQGYTCGLLTPNATRNMSSTFQISSASSTQSLPSTTINELNTSYRQLTTSEAHDDSVLDTDDSNIPTTSNQGYHPLPTIDMVRTRVENAADYNYFKSCRHLDASLEVQSSTSVAVKRAYSTEAEVQAEKRYRDPQVGPQDEYKSKVNIIM